MNTLTLSNNEYNELCKEYYNEIEEFDSISVYYNPLYWEVN